MIKYLVQRAKWLLGIVNRYFGVLFIYVLTGLGCGTVIFLLVLNSAYGILPANLLLAKKATNSEVARSIALLSSGYSIAASQKMQGNHQKQVEVWSSYLKESGATVQLITDADLERGIDSKFPALALPGSIALSDVEIEKIRRFVRAGGGLLVEGPTGTRDPDDHWRGWDLVKDLTNAESVEVLSAQGQQRRFVTLVGGAPTAVGLAPGLKVENSFYSENYGVPASAPAAYWSEWIRPFTPDKPYLAALKIHHYGAGRVVWLGFNLAAMREQEEPHQAVIRLLQNATDWVMQQPIAQVAAWPHAEQGAASLTFDCESDFTNLSNILNLPEASSLRFTFFMLSSVAQRYPDLVQQAAARGEVAIHGDDHSVFSNQPYDTQLQRLTRAKSVLEVLSKTAIVSFRPPEQQYDANTLLALRKTGLKNIFADYLGVMSPRLEAADKSAPNLRLPFLTSATAITKIPRPNYDDYDLFVRNSFDASQAGALLVEDMKQVTGQGGLYVLSMHTTAPWGGLNRDKIAALTALVHALPGRRIWLATVKEAADWWLARSQIRIKATKYSNSVILLQVTNSSDRTLEDLPIEVHLPSNYSKVEVQNSKVEFQTPKWKFGESGQLIVFIPAIKSGESKSYILTNGNAVE